MYYFFNVASINLIFVVVQAKSSLRLLPSIKTFQFNGSTETYGKELKSSWMWSSITGQVTNIWKKCGAFIFRIMQSKIILEPQTLKWVLIQLHSIIFEMTWIYSNTTIRTQKSQKLA
jgi:hypothetical protein